MVSRRSCLLVATTIATALSAHGQVLYSSDFEADDGGLVVTGTDWEHGVPTSGPGVAHSGTKCWGTNLAGSITPQEYQRLSLLDIDASAATDDDVIVVRWWQYYDQPPMFLPTPFFRSFVYAGSGLSSQNIYGRLYTDKPYHENLPHVGWQERTAVLGADYATSTLGFTFSIFGHENEGMYVDDVSVELVRKTTISLDDFESGPGGFSGNWFHGIQMGCPVPVTAPSGQYVWSTNVDFCSHGMEQTLYSPVLDLSSYAGLREVYLTWNRFSFFELADGVHHEVSYNGGLDWEDAAGWHVWASSDSSFFGWNSYGLVVDLTTNKGTDVQFRWRVNADSFEFEYGMWIDDFAVSVREAIPGSGANPPGSLTVSAGDFTLGSTVELSLVDPAGAFPVPNTSRVVLSLAGDPNLPAGTSIPGYGMSGPAAPGDVLVDLAAQAGSAGGTPWTPGNPAKVTAQIPSLPSIAGLEVYLQGALIAFGPLNVGLTNGLFEVLSP